MFIIVEKKCQIVVFFILWNRQEKLSFYSLNAKYTNDGNAVASMLPECPLRVSLDCHDP